MIRSVKSIDSIPSPIPIGTIIDYYGTSQPDGWLICDGREVPSYMTKLRELIGNATPDLRGLFRRMIGGNAAGIGVKQDMMIQKHSHTYMKPSGDGFDFLWGNGCPRITSETGETGGIETRPVNMAFNAIIYGGEKKKKVKVILAKLFGGVCLC